MNEIFFLIHVLLVLSFTIGAARIGPEALIALVAINGVLANLFVVKQMDLFGFQVTCSDVFAVGGIIGLNLLQEYFGKDEAKRAIKISFFAMVFFVLVSQIHLWYIPSALDRTHDAFSLILSSAPRIVIASIAVYFVVQKIDIALFGWLKILFRGGDDASSLGKKGRSLAIRMGISLVLTQFIDTVLFSFAGLYGLVASVFDCIILSFAVKCLVIAASAPLAALSRRFVKENEAA